MTQAGGRGVRAWVLWWASRGGAMVRAGFRWVGCSAPAQPEPERRWPPPTLRAGALTRSRGGAPPAAGEGPHAGRATLVWGAVAPPAQGSGDSAARAGGVPILTLLTNMSSCSPLSRMTWPGRGRRAEAHRLAARQLQRCLVKEGEAWSRGFEGAAPALRDRRTRASAPPRPICL